MRKALAFIGIALVATAIALLTPWHRLLSPAQHTSSEFDIATYKSSIDADGDGIDDATDIVASARAYLDTNPHYGSAYYQGGYPDDGRGVCTDVVAQAFLGAGYDLRALVDEDVRLDPSAYGIEEPDANIDFRRVRNLRVFFERNAQVLTLDTSELDVWQGGDIVCWGEHIGVISDMRNAQGVPLVLHHDSPYQLHFEEDVLNASTWGPIVGHYRWT